MDVRPGRRTCPAFESLDARALLSAYFLHPVDENGKTLPPQVLAAAYHEVQASQFVTLRSLGASYQQVEAAFTGFRQGAPTGPTLVEGTAAVDQFIQALQVAAGVERSDVVGEESQITNGLFTNVETIVTTATTGGAAIARKALERADATVALLDALGNGPAEDSFTR